MHKVQLTLILIVIIIIVSCDDRQADLRKSLCSRACLGIETDNQTVICRRSSDVMCKYQCLTACLQPWSSWEGCYSVTCYKYLQSNSTYRAKPCIYGCRLMHELQRKNLSSLNYQKYLLSGILNNATIMEIINGQGNCMKFTANGHLASTSAQNSNPIGIAKDGKKVNQCPCTPSEIRNQSLSDYKLKTKSARIIAHNNNFHLQIKWIPKTGYTGYYQVAYYLRMRNDSIPNPKPCIVTMDTNATLLIDGIANISHYSIYNEGISFAVYIIPNPSNSFQSKPVNINNVKMTIEVKQKYKEKYNLYPNNPLLGWLYAFISLGSTTILGVAIYSTYMYYHYKTIRHQGKLCLQYLLKKYMEISVEEIRQKMREVRNVDEARIQRPEYAIVLPPDINSEVDSKLLEVLRCNRIGFTTLPKLLSDASLPVAEVIFDKLTEYDKIILYVTPRFVELISTYRKRRYVNEESDDQELIYVKGVWSMILEKLYNCPGTNDVILVTNTQYYNDRFMKFANFHLGFRNVKIHDINGSQYASAIENLTTTTQIETAQTLTSQMV